jgi:hypothetical protein
MNKTTATCRILVAIVSVTAAVTAMAAQPLTREQFSGVWEIEKPVFAVRTVSGKLPPLLPEAARIYQQHVAARRRGDTSFDSATWCAAAGLPRLMLMPYPFQIAVQPKYVVFLHEWNWWAHVVYLEGAMARRFAKAQSANFEVPPAPLPAIGLANGAKPGAAPPAPSMDAGDDVFQPSAMGFSTGRWEGNVLIVDTSHFIDSTVIDGAGLPHSDRMKVTEHLRLTGADELEDLIRIEDPGVYKEPWETRVLYRRGVDRKIREDVCLDRIANGQPAVRSVP